MKGPETRLGRRIIRALKEAFPGSCWKKIHGNRFQNKGISDLLGCVEGWYFALEVKCMGKHATEVQEAFMDEVKVARGAATVVYSPKQAVDFVTKELKRRKSGKV